VAALAGCGGHAKTTSPESVVRAWSDALNANDNEAAADLFAANAEVMQGKYEVRLTSHGAAVAFNAAFPCAGKIVRLQRDGDVVTATFVLADRPGSRCDGPGQEATTAFTVRNGKIAVWQQLPEAREPAAA
jgi:limonene-1,2-epoxide hydrolase